MDLRVQRVGDVTVVTVQAEALDAFNSQTFKEQFAERAGKALAVVVDLGPVGFMDSTGCGGLLSALKRVREAGGDLKACGVGASVRAFFDLVRIQRLMDIFPTCEEAIASFPG
jgi:anti-sigma B factor antagonist